MDCARSELPGAVFETNDDRLAEAAPLMIRIHAHALHLDARLVEGTERTHRDDDAVELADQEVAPVPEIRRLERFRRRKILPMRPRVDVGAGLFEPEHVELDHSLVVARLVPADLERRHERELASNCSSSVRICPYAARVAFADFVVPMRRALEAAWGGALTLGEPERLSNRDHVARVAVRDAAGETTSVVVKEPRPDGVRQFASEWAALEALGSVESAVPPRLLAASADPPFLVMEDVGGGPSLAGLLLGDERVAASAALVTFAEGLADLHAAGIAHVDLFEARMHALGCEPTATTYDAAFPMRDNRAAWTDALAELGIDAGALDTDLDEIAGALTEPGPFRGIVHGDPCPDNVRFVDGRLRVFDFETAFVGHVLLDATYLSVPFPSCWCVASLPPRLVAPANAAYRARLGMVDATHWDHQVTLAWAAWLVATIPRQLERTRDENPEWGVSTLRARVAGRLTRFAERTTAVNELHALTETMRRMRDLLVARWPEDDTELPAYPAFAEPGERVATPPDWWSETM
jgi:Ser/Thr protein kinase RdoA (MazF antagonist)